MESMKPRVLFCTPDCRAGGAGIALLRMLRGLQGRRYDVQLFVEIHEGDLLSQLPANVPVRFGLPHERGFALWRYLCLLIATIRAGRHADILVSWVEGRTSFITRVAGLLLRKPVVGWIHVNWGVFQDHASRRATMATMALRHVHTVVAVSEGVAVCARQMLGISDDRIKVVYNGQDLNELAARAAEPLSPADEALVGPHTIASIGRLVPVKGYDMLLEAMAEVVRREPRAKLLLIGEGPAHDRLHEQAQRLGIEDHVAFAGHRNNPFALLSRCGMFVSSSRAEGLQLALLEAMAFGLPVAAFNCPSGPSEILQDSVYGLLVPANDTSALADALVKLLQDPELAAHYRDQSLKRARDFSLEQFVAGAEAVFDAALDGEASDAPAAACR